MRIFNFHFIILFTGRPEFNYDQYFDCDKPIKRVPYFCTKTGVSWFLLNINMKRIRVVGVVFGRWGQNCRYTHLRRCPIIFSAPQSTVRTWSIEEKCRCGMSRSPGMYSSTLFVCSCSVWFCRSTCLVRKITITSPLSAKSSFSPRCWAEGRFRNEGNTMIHSSLPAQIFNDFIITVARVSQRKFLTWTSKDTAEPKAQRNFISPRKTRRLHRIPRKTKKN